MTASGETVVLTEAERLCVERLAAHLRRVAELLLERGETSPPIAASRWFATVFSKQIPEAYWRAFFKNWLREIIAHRSVDDMSLASEKLIKALDLVEQLDTVSPDSALSKVKSVGERYDILEGKTPTRRLYQRATRINIEPDLSVARTAVFCATWPSAHGCFHSSSALTASYYWICRRPGLRFKLTRASAPYLNTLAAVAEITAALPQSVPKWGLHPAGRWKSIAYNLVMQFAVSSEYIEEKVLRLGIPVRIDLLSHRIEPPGLMEFRNLNLTNLCGRSLQLAAERNNDRLRTAQLTLHPNPDKSVFYEVYLETLDQGVHLEGRLKTVGHSYVWMT